MSGLTRDLLAARHTRVRASFADGRLDALVVTHLPNVRYLTGFAGSAGLAVLTPEALLFITDGRYVTYVREEVEPLCPGFRLVPVEPTYDATLARVIEEHRWGRIGFESSYMSVGRFRGIEAAMAEAAVRTGSVMALVPTDRRVETERLRKDEAELAAFRRAGELLDEVAAGVLAALRPGQVERDIAADIDFRLKTGGFEGPSFDTIVASGPNSAMPHARPGRRAIAPGDLVVLDFGGVYDGYCVDLTRTVSVGEPAADARRLYEAVLEAQAAALAVVRPGTRVSEVDEAARAVLERHGYGADFSHATGHGLGLEIHEEPRVGPARAGIPGVAPVARDEMLEPGVVITVEPGAYLAGVGGVRIEDDVAVVAGGSLLLTHVSRKLLVV